MGICPTYITKYSSSRKKKVNLLIILNGRGWHFLAMKKLPALLRRIILKNNGYSYCLNCLYSFRTKNELKSHEKLCKNKDICGIALPPQKDNIIKFNQYLKSDKPPCMVYADLKSLIKKIDGSSATKVDEHIPCGYSMSTIWEFDDIENKHSLSSGKDCMKKFCISPREHAANVISFDYCHFAGKYRGAAYSMFKI